VVAVLAVTSAGPAAATDDGDDLSDLLIDEVQGYELQPPGNPAAGRSGPVDWNDLGSLPGVDTGDLPDDTPEAYANVFLAQDRTTFAVVMGIDTGGIDPAILLGAVGAGLGEFGSSDHLTLPGADAAGVRYEAREMAPQGGPSGETDSAAALAGEGIVVMVVVTSFDGDAAEEHRVLDRFVIAQAQFEPSVTADSSPPARPRRIDPTRRVAAGDERSSARMAGAIISWTLLTVGFALLAGLLVRRWQATRAVAAASAPAAGWNQAAGSWPSASGRHLTGSTTASRTAGPPLPPSAGPPLAPLARPPLPPPPLRVVRPLPPPVPAGGSVAGRRAAPGAPPPSAPEPGDAGTSVGGWILPG
jgi:hypothetical protein